MIFRFAWYQPCFTRVTSFFLSFSEKKQRWYTELKYCHISHTFRSLLLGTPSLWVNVMAHGKTPLSLISVYLSRSENLPINVVLDFGRYAKASDVRPVLDLLLPESLRWRRFVFNSRHKSVNTLVYRRVRRAQLPRLEALLCMDVSDRSHLNASEEFVLPWIRLPNTRNITVLDISHFRRISMEVDFSNFKYFPRLEVLRLKYVIVKRLTTPILLPTLRMFVYEPPDRYDNHVYDIPALLNNFNAPKLEHLEFRQIQERDWILVRAHLTDKDNLDKYPALITLALEELLAERPSTVDTIEELVEVTEKYFGSITLLPWSGQRELHCTGLRWYWVPRRKARLPADVAAEDMVITLTGVNEVESLGDTLRLGKIGIRMSVFFCIDFPDNCIHGSTFVEEFSEPTFMEMQAWRGLLPEI